MDVYLFFVVCVLHVASFCIKKNMSLKLLASQTRLGGDANPIYSAGDLEEVLIAFAFA